MIQMEVSSEVLLKQSEVLEACLSTDPKMEAKVRRVIRRALLDARREMMGDIPYIHGDPRGSRRAIRTSVYRAILGGQVNIFSSRKAHGQNSYEKPRKLDQNPHQRGGNRRPRSEMTKRMDSYEGADRGMILRWLNQETGNRSTKYGNRGRISGNNWFAGASAKALEEAAEKLAKMVEEEMVKN